MKVFIVGGRGNIGQEVAMGLIRQEEIDKVILGDLNADPAGLRDRLRKNGKISLVKVDATDRKSLAGMLKDADIAVNCAGPFQTTALVTAKAAVEAGVDYIDVCDDYEAVDTLFNSDIDTAAKKAGVTVLTGMGSDPGTNNIIATRYARRLDRVEEIRLFWAVGIAELAGAAWEHSLSMTTGVIPQFLDGKLEYVEGGTGEETVRFPEPLGACTVRYVGHPQPLTMPRSIEGLRNVVVKGALLPAWVDRLIREQKEAGLLSKIPLDIKGMKVTPYDLALRLWDTISCSKDVGPSCSGLKVIVKGEREGKSVTFTADMVGEMGPGTGLPASIAARMLGAGKISVKGLVTPEACVDPGTFLAALLESGARIYQTETVESMLEAETA